MHLAIHVRILARQRTMKPISEASFMAQVKALAYQYGWVVHHSQPSMTRTGRYMTMGSVGFFDLVMAHQDRGLIFAELKTQKGKTTEAQDYWHCQVERHAECYVWRPSDLQLIADRLASC